MKKLSLSQKLMYLSAAVMLLSLLPLLILGQYAVPAADDFSYGAPAHLAYAGSGSFLSAAAAALDKTAESYVSWQGTFSAIFLMAMQPAVFSEGLYALTPFIMLAAVVLGSFLFCRAFFGELLGLDKAAADLIAALVSFVGVQLLPSPVQGLFWYNGSVYYMFFHGLLLAGFAVGLSLVRRGGALRCTALCFIAFMIGGGNYVTALTAMILAFFAIALLLLLKNKAWKRLLLPALILAAAFAVNAAAPGNAVRQAAQADTPGAVEAVLLSFRAGFEYGLEWFSLPVLGALVLAGFAAWPLLGNSNSTFRAPFIVTLFSYCLFSAMFCPPVYAMGNVGDKRLLNIVYLSYILLLTVNLIYWLGWLSGKLSSGKTLSRKGAFAALTAGLAVFAILSAFAMLRGTGFAAVGALSTLRSGEAQEYHACAQQRFALLHDETIADAVLEPFSVTPYLLYFDDITADPSDWRNEDMSTFYGKNSVVLAGG